MTDIEELIEEYGLIEILIGLELYCLDKANPALNKNKEERRFFKAKANQLYSIAKEVQENNHE